MDSDHLKYIEELKEDLKNGSSNVHKDFWKIGIKLAMVKHAMQKNKANYISSDNRQLASNNNFSKFIYEQLEKKICRRFVYHLIAAGEIMSNLKKHQERMGWPMLPANERQCREMKSLTPEQQVYVWDAVLKSRSKVTNTLIKTTISSMYPKED